VRPPPKKVKLPLHVSPPDINLEEAVLKILNQSIYGKEP
jgi:hypothetical protein